MYENKVSVRQMRRIIFIETFGAGALSVPLLACYKGQSGLWAFFFYGIFLAGITTFFLVFSGKINKKGLEAYIMPQSIKSIYIVRFSINAVALFYFFGKTIQTVYMPESGFLFILFPAVILLCYSLYTTLQKRARFLELIFPWIITTYFIAVILSFIGIEKAMQVGRVGELWQGIFSDSIFQSMRNGYLLLLCSSPIEFILFLRPVVKVEAENNNARSKIMENKNAQNNNIKSKNIEDKNTGNSNAERKNIEDKNARRKNIKDKNNKATRGIITAAAGTFFCNVIFSFLAVRTLGPALVSQSEWPVIKMMQLIRMPGGFLERFDILPIIFWILCMMAVLSGYLYYSWALCRSMINCYGRDFDRKRLNYCGKDSARSMLNPYNRNSNQDLINNSSINDRCLSDVQNEKYIRLWFAGIAVICLLLLSYLVEKNTFLWTYYLKYKAFVDFPLSLILPVVVYIFKGKKENSCEYREKEENKNGKKERGFEYQEKVNEKKEPIKKERKNNLVKNEKNEIEKASVTKYFSEAVIILFLLIVFSLTGCQRLTDVEEKSYILSMYVDCPSDKEKVEGDTEKNTCEFWLARANLSKMEEQSDEIPCQITKIKARNLQELEEKYLETVPGKIEWNHIYSIFVGSSIAADKDACIRLLKEWDNAWQKSPNVLLALCSESPKKLYKIKNIPEGVAGQEARLLAEQNKKKYSKYSEQICETPIDYLRAKQQKRDEMVLYRITIEKGKMKLISKKTWGV